MTWRNIIVNDKKYRWKFGSSYTIIQDENGKRLGNNIPSHEMFGVTPDVWERAGYKGYRAITPKHIKEYIETMAL